VAEFAEVVAADVQVEATAEVTKDCVGRGSSSSGLNWISLPAGTYQMGSESGSADEQPMHSVTLAGFQMAKSETTQVQYQKCLDDACCDAPPGYWNPSGKGDHPVTYVNWFLSAAYCEWAGGRLCTEAEWEYAARSGGKDQTYPWGNQAATCAFAVMYDADGDGGCGTGGTWAVCSKTAGNSSQGACDLAGNVREWVADWYETYPSTGQTNPTGPASGSYRVIRGGGRGNDAGGLRATSRGLDDPHNNNYYYDDLGFRCCRSLN
jgi:serine/threonine-protein kinase